MKKFKHITVYTCIEYSYKTYAEDIKQKCFFL